MKDMGRVMKAATERLGPAADGKTLSAAVKRKLAAKRPLDTRSASRPSTRSASAQHALHTLAKHAGAIAPATNRGGGARRLCRGAALTLGRLGVGRGP